jgi:zinc transporter, ZIP family
LDNEGLLEAFILMAKPTAGIAQDHRLNEKLNNNLLSFAAGVMLAASIFSLLLPAVERSKASGASTSSSVFQAVGFLFVGGFVLWADQRADPA